MFLESNSNHISKLLFTLTVQIFMFLSASTAYSKITANAGKGLLNIFKGEHQALSPLFGLAALESGKIDEIYQESEPDDSLHQLARGLFHKVDTELLPTQLGVNPATHLSARSIGKIVRLLINYNFYSSKMPYYDLVTEIKMAIILDKDYYSSHSHTIDRYNNKKNEIDVFVEQHKQGKQRRKTADELYKGTLTKLNREIKNQRWLKRNNNSDFDKSLEEALIKERLEVQKLYDKYIEGTLPASKFRSLKTRLDNELKNLDLNNLDYFHRLDNFIQNLVDSYLNWQMETRHIDSSPINLLLAYMWLKYDKKEDLEPYMIEMDEMAATKYTFKKLLKPEWQAYTKEDFQNLMSKLSKSKRSILAALSSQFEQVLLLKIIKPGNSGSAPITKYRVLSGTKEQTFADCGENSIRNFINILIYNRKNANFDPTILESLQSIPGYKLLHGLIEFYKEHSNPSSASESYCYDAWNELISSLNHKVPTTNEEKVKYFYKNRFDITGGYSNMKKVIKKVFGHDDIGKIVDDVNKIGNKNIAFDDRALVEKSSNFGRIYIKDEQNDYVWGFQLFHFYFTRLKSAYLHADPIGKIIIKVDQIAQEELALRDKDNCCFPIKNRESYWNLLEALLAINPGC